MSSRRKRVRVAFGGLSQSEEWKEGEMQELVNLRVTEGGHLRPVPYPTPVADMTGAGEEVLGGVVRLVMHRGEGYGNLLWVVAREGYDEVLVSGVDAAGKPKRVTGKEELKTVGRLPDGEEVTGVSVIGNVVSVVTRRDIYYVLWKGGGYVWLGAFPELPVLNFGAKEDGETKVHIDLTSETDSSLVSDYIAGAYYKTQAQVEGEWRRKKVAGLPLFSPHIVRYAFRLYDGTLVKHSAPVYVQGKYPKEKYAALGEMQRQWAALRGIFDLRKKKIEEINKELEGFPYDFAGIPSDAGIMPLDFGVAYYQLYADFFGDVGYLGQWTDIIKSVDVFISEGLWSGEEAGEGGEGAGGVRWNPAGRTSGRIARGAGGGEAAKAEKGAVRGGENEVVEKSQFYLLRRISIEDFISDSKMGLRYVFPDVGDEIEKESDITSGEVMSNQGYSNHRYGGERVYTLNRRLRLGDVYTTLFKGHGAGLFLDDESTGLEALGREGGHGVVKGKETVDLKVGGETVRVSHEFEVKGEKNLNPYYSYPDVRAVYAKVEVAGKVLLDAPLKPHPFLDIAYYVDPDVVQVTGRDPRTKVRTELPDEGNPNATVERPGGSDDRVNPRWQAPVEEDGGGGAEGGNSRKRR